MIVPTYETTAREQEIIINNQRKEIERLNKERNKLYENGLNDFLEFQKKREEKDKEIERLKEELEFEKTTNKELLSTGAELENKLYEEQDKNKRLKKELQEEKEEKEHYQAIVESWE